jgi:hypothetical protein
LFVAGDDNAWSGSGKYLMNLKASRPGIELTAIEWLAVGLSLVAGCIVLWGIWHGLDLTDEGYYLNSIRDPFLYKSSYSQFGFLLHPLYVLVGGKLVLIRLVGILLLVAAASILAVVFVRLPINSAIPQPNRRLLTIAWSATALLFYCLWIPTPSYNHLNLFGALVVFIGWLQIIGAAHDSASRRGRRFTAIAICGAGFAIVALVKPTTAAAMAIVLTPLTLVFGRRALMDIVAAGVVAFVLVVLILIGIDGDPVNAVARYRSALHLNALSQSSHDWDGFSRTFTLHLKFPDWLSLGVMAALGPLVAVAIWLDRKLALLLACGVVFVAQGVLFHPLLIEPNTNYGVSNFSLGALTLTGLATTWLLMRRNPGNADTTDWRYLVVLLALLLAPVGFAFGTNTLIWWGAVRAGIFWIMGVVLLITLAAPPVARLRWIQFVTATCAFLLLQSIFYAVQSPYRLTGPLWEQTEWVSSATEPRMVKVDPATASYFRTLLAEGRSAGLQVGTPVIDMTGTAPSTLYVLGTEPVGLAWIAGGYPGSRELASYALSQFPRDTLQRSWILTAPAGHRPLPPDTLKDIGLSFPEGYQEVARARTGFADEIHILWRPRSGQTPPPGLSPLNSGAQ